jgi:hypothetical protein
LTRFLTHKIGDLVTLAGLGTELTRRRQGREFDIRWAVIAEWTEESRYDLIDSVLASTMQDAIEHPHHGAMTWLKQFW